MRKKGLLYACNINMNENEILNCKTIMELEKRVAELEKKLQEQPQKQNIKP